MKLARRYEADRGRWPNGLDELVRDGLLERPVDPWGRSYLYELGKDGPKVWSQGPDATMEDDDIQPDTYCPRRRGGCGFVAL